MQADPAGYLTQARQKIFETQMEIQALQSKKSALNNVIRQYESEFGQIPQKSIRARQASAQQDERREAVHGGR